MRFGLHGQFTAHPRKMEQVALSRLDLSANEATEDVKFYQLLLVELADATPTERYWSSWLEWRKGRRSKPEWLRKMQEAAKHGGGLE